MRKDVTVRMTDSMEATPIAHLVQLANQFGSSIYFEMDTKKVNAKSIMGMMTLGLASGEKVVVTANGKDEAEAIQNIEEYLSATK